MREDVKGLSGGKKQLWLSLHQPEVLSFLHAHDREATKLEFNMQDPTLDRLLDDDKRGRNRHLTKSDRAIIMTQMTQESIRELRSEVEDLKKEYNEFAPRVVYEVSVNFAGLLKRALETIPDLPITDSPVLKDKLSLEDWTFKRDK